MSKAGVACNHTNPHPDTMRTRDRPVSESAIGQRMAEERVPKPRSGRKPAGHGKRAIDPEVLSMARGLGVVAHPYRHEEVAAARHDTVEVQPGPSRLVRKSGKDKETGGKPIT